MYKQKDLFMNSVYFTVSLSDHMVLQSDNRETDVFMDAMEAIRILPITITWYGKDGFTNRIYYVPDTDNLSGPLDINLGNLHLIMPNGSRNQITMPSIQPADHIFQWVPGRSLEDMNPAKLPTSILGLLFHLAYITSLNLLKEDVTKLMSSFEPVEYN